MTTTEEKIAVMQAYVDGKTIQWQSREGASWEDNNSPVWDWQYCNYRIKPEPRRFWIHKHPGGALYALDAPNANQNAQAKQFFDKVEVIEVVEVSSWPSCQ